MSKSLLVIETPECCEKCMINLDGFCLAVLEPNECVEGGEMRKETPKACKPEWCPLRSVPERRNESDTCYESDYYRAQGWNSCIDEICEVEK